MYDLFSCPAGRYCQTKTGTHNQSNIDNCRKNPVTGCTVGIICPPNNFCNQFVK